MANKLWTVCIFILVVEIAERLCYYSISGTQRNFLTDYPTVMDQGAAGAINSVFTMLSYLSCFLGGYLADQWLGRYKTILIFASCYFGGTVMVAASSTPDAVNIPIYLAGCLFFISLGTGAIKPNVMTFGASQYDESDPVERAQQKTFFSYFYLMINVGAGITFGFLVNIATSDVTPTSLGWGFFKVYVIAAVAMGLAVLSFLAGTCRYKKEPPTVHRPIISVICKYMCRNCSKSAAGMMAVTGWLLMPIYITLNLIGSVLDNAPLTNTCMVLCLISSIFLILGHMKNDWIQEFSEEIHGAGVTLHDAKRVVRLVPQLLLINIGFNIPYNAMNNAYPALACQMDLRLPWNEKTQLNGAFCNLGDCLAIIIGVPIIEACIYPALERRRGRAISRKSKYILGFSFAIAANLVSIVIEDIRRTKEFVPGDDGLSKCAPSSLLIHMSEMSCFYAFIPMFMTGIGEILVNPVVYEFAFAEAPPQLLSVVQAFNLVVAGSISNCITGPLSILVFPNNLNNFDEDNPLSGIKGQRGDVNITFILNAVIGLACLIAYLVVENLDECDPEDLTLKKDDDQPLAEQILT